MRTLVFHEVGWSSPSVLHSCKMLVYLNIFVKESQLDIFFTSVYFDGISMPILYTLGSIKPNLKVVFSM